MVASSGDGGGGDDSIGSHDTWVKFQRRLQESAEAIADEADSLADVSMTDIAEAAIEARYNQPKP